MTEDISEERENEDMDILRPPRAALVSPCPKFPAIPLRPVVLKLLPVDAVFSFRPITAPLPNPCDNASTAWPKVPLLPPNSPPALAESWVTGLELVADEKILLTLELEKMVFVNPLPKFIATRSTPDAVVFIDVVKLSPVKPPIASPMPKNFAGVAKSLTRLLIRLPFPESRPVTLEMREVMFPSPRSEAADVAAPSRPESMLDAIPEKNEPILRASSSAVSISRVERCDLCDAIKALISDIAADA